VEPFVAFLATGAGILSQAVLKDQVLSSALVLLSKSGAYYQTAGTSPEGNELGASPFLVFETARNLRERGLEIFNLGGVSGVNPGLDGFKNGFGPDRRSLAAAEYDLRTSMRRALEGPIQALRGMVSGLAQRKSGRPA
jgi:lipid II:glycine glycyltransferase (peptidoglycan interpeptide bridge formation enzyme)